MTLTGSLAVALGLAALIRLMTKPTGDSRVPARTRGEQVAGVVAVTLAAAEAASNLPADAAAGALAVILAALLALWPTLCNLTIAGLALAAKAPETIAAISHDPKVALGMLLIGTMTTLVVTPTLGLYRLQPLRHLGYTALLCWTQLDLLALLVLGQVHLVVDVAAGGLLAAAAIVAIAGSLQPVIVLRWLPPAIILGETTLTAVAHPARAATDLTIAAMMAAIAIVITTLRHTYR